MCNCGKKKRPPAQGAASECGHMVNHRGMKWCLRCAAAKDVCPCCGKRRAPKKPKKKAPRASKA